MSPSTNSACDAPLEDDLVVSGHAGEEDLHGQCRRLPGVICKHGSRALRPDQVVHDRSHAETVLGPSPVPALRIPRDRSFSGTREGGIRGKVACIRHTWPHAAWVREGPAGGGGGGSHCCGITWGVEHTGASNACGMRHPAFPLPVKASGTRTGVASRFVSHFALESTSKVPSLDEVFGVRRLVRVRVGVGVGSQGEGCRR